MNATTDSKKYTGTFAEPCPFSNDAAKREWKAEGRTLPVKIFVKGGEVWINKAKHYVGVKHPRATGGKWERVNIGGRVFATVEELLQNYNAEISSFRGQPKGC